MPFKDSRSVLGGGFRPHSLLKLSLKPEAEEQKRGQAAERLPGLDVECPEGRRPRQVRAQGGDAGRRGPVGRKLTHPGRQGPREANRPGRSPLGPPARARLPLKLRPKPAPASLPRPASSRTLTHSPDEPTHPDPGELILQPSARRRVGAVSHRDATGARFGLRPRRAAAPARSPVARPCDPRLARTDALEPEPAFLPAPFSPPSSLAERQQADSNLSSGRHRRHSRRGGRGGRCGLRSGAWGEGRASARRGAARAHWECTRRAPPRTRKEPSARRKRPKGLRCLAPGCRVGGPAAVLGAPGCCRGVFSSARSRQPLLTKKPHCRRRGAASLRKPCQADTVRGTHGHRSRVLRAGRAPWNGVPSGESFGADSSDKLIFHVSASWWAGEISLIAQNPRTVVRRQRKQM